MRKRPRLVSLSLLLGHVGRSVAADLPRVRQVELPPLVAQVLRLVGALDYLGTSLPHANQQALRVAAARAKGVATI